MKRLIILLAAAPILIISACSNSTASSEKLESAATSAPISNPSSEPAATKLSDTTATAKSEVYYQCPMHKEVVSDKPGKCPKCGMKLVEKKKG